MVAPIPRDYPLNGQFEDRFADIGPCPSTGKPVRICYNAFGDPAHPCILLVQGLGTSALGYSTNFIRLLVAQGYYVVRYDNRDVGLSTHFAEFPAPFLVRLIVPPALSLGERLPYTLQDMMEDGMGLLTALGIQQAHVFGMSMGGMIAQLMAIHHPDRVLTLNILFSHAGGADNVWPSILTYARFIVPYRADTIDDKINHLIWYVQFLAQGHHMVEEHHLRAYLYETCDRNNGELALAQGRQIAALMRAPGRREALAKLTCPTVIMHGLLDPLIPVENGRRLTQIIPRSKLVLYPDLAHDFPPYYFKEFASEILMNIKKYEESAAA